MFKPAIVAPLLAAITALAVALCPAWDYDIWFQLACGRAITGLGTLPATDIFSFTATSHPWDSQEWLSQIIFFFIEDRAGLSVLTIIKAAASGLLFLLISRHAIRRGANPWLTLAISAWGAFLLRWFTVERPAMFSIVFLALQLSALSRGRAPWWLVPLSAVWANLHGGSALLGPGITALWLAGTAIPILWRRESLTGLRGSSFVLAGQALALLLNPAGWHLFLYPFATTSDLMYMENVKEWMPPTATDFPGFFGLLMVVLLVFSITMLSWEITDILLMLAFGWLALSARRHIPLFVIAIIPIVAAASSRLFSGLLANPRARILTPALSVIFPICLVGALAWNGSALRTGVRHNLYPESGIAFLKSNYPVSNKQEPLRLYTLHKWGGYAEWFLSEQFKVFIDGRQMVYGTGLFTDYYRILEDTPEASDLLRDWYPDAFLLDYGSKLGRRFARTREMALVQWNDSSLLFLARNKRNAALIRRFEYRSFNPEAGFKAKPGAMEEDIRRAIRENPGNGRPWNSLAALYLLLGKAKEARKASAEALKVSPKAVPVLLTAADSAMALQDWNDASKLISRARSADSGACGPRYSLAKAALLAGDDRRALQLADEAISTGLKRKALWHKPEPALVDSYLLRAGLLAKESDTARSADALRRAGNTAFELGDPEAALDIYRRGMATAPSDARFYHNTGVVLSTSGKNAEAIIYLRRALQLDARNSDTMAALGVAYFRIKLLPLAREMWKLAVATTPNHPEATLYLKQTADK